MNTLGATLASIRSPTESSSGRASRDDDAAMFGAMLGALSDGPVPADQAPSQGGGAIAEAGGTEASTAMARRPGEDANSALEMLAAAMDPAEAKTAGRSTAKSGVLMSGLDEAKPGEDPIEAVIARALPEVGAIVQSAAVAAPAPSEVQALPQGLLQGIATSSPLDSALALASVRTERPAIGEPVAASSRSSGSAEASVARLQITVIAQETHFAPVTPHLLSLTPIYASARAAVDGLPAPADGTIPAAVPSVAVSPQFVLSALAVDSPPFPAPPAPTVVAGAPPPEAMLAPVSDETLATFLPAEATARFGLVSSDAVPGNAPVPGPAVSAAPGMQAATSPAVPEASLLIAQDQVPVLVPLEAPQAGQSMPASATDAASVQVPATAAPVQAASAPPAAIAQAGSGAPLPQTARNRAASLDDKIKDVPSDADASSEAVRPSQALRSDSIQPPVDAGAMKPRDPATRTTAEGTRPEVGVLSGQVSGRVSDQAAGQANGRIEAAVSPLTSPLPTAGGPARQVAEAVVAEAVRMAPTQSLAGPAGLPGPLRILTIQLRPDDLGTVVVRMRLRGDQLEMNLQASREETANLLRSGGAVLDDLLRGAGYQPDVVTIGSNRADPPLAGGSGFEFNDQAANGRGDASPDQSGRRQPDPRDAERSDNPKERNSDETNPAGPGRIGRYL